MISYGVHKRSKRNGRVIKILNESGGFCSALALVFITLKLTNTIVWSWFWVLSPIWAPLVIGGVIFLIIIMGEH